MKYQSQRLIQHYYLYRVSEELLCTCSKYGTLPPLAQRTGTLRSRCLTYELTQLLRVRVCNACSQAGDWEDRPDRVWRGSRGAPESTISGPLRPSSRDGNSRQPSAHVTGRLCVTSRFGPPSWWRVGDVRSRDEGRWQWQRTRHPASYVLPSVTLGHSTRYIYIYIYIENIQSYNI